MTQRSRVGVLGATGMVGQRFVALLAEHPWFEAPSTDPVLLRYRYDPISRTVEPDRLWGGAA